MDKREIESITINEADVKEQTTCHACDHLFVYGAEAILVDYEYFCDERCLAEHGQCQAEMAHERYLNRFYGGEVATQQEQYVQAWRDKEGR
jgi:hypothetical protein